MKKPLADDIEIVIAQENDIHAVVALVQKTIDEIYPKFYGNEIVTFFLAHHCADNIAADIAARRTVILKRDGTTVATGSFSGNHIYRVFVLSDEQGRGFGKLIMEILESKIFGEFDEVALETSFGAKEFYEHIGYEKLREEEIMTESGALLKYDVMKKCRRL